MLRIATEKDFDLVLDMAMKFAKASPYADLMEQSYIEKVIADTLSNPFGIILLNDGGMLAGVAVPWEFGPYYIATEKAWWIDPDKRRSHLGDELLSAFEEWAARVGANFVHMVSLDDSVGKYYEKKGYKLYERAYMKGL